MRYICALYICFTLCLSAANEARNEPFLLKASNGATVEVVAVYSMDSEGLQFSPLPDAPLIGSNTLAVLSTPWANIDTTSLGVDPELSSAYEKAQAGESVTLNIGSHFNDLSEIKKRVSKAIPKVTVYYSDGRSIRILLTKFITDKNRLRASHWAVSDSEKSRLVKAWDEIYKELEFMVYRPEVSKFQYDLKKAQAIIERVDSKSGTFNATSARDLERLLLQL
ncbi:MAG: hypothetical protein ACSHX8_03940 [Opitutaceae bacterium]